MATTAQTEAMLTICAEIAQALPTIPAYRIACAVQAAQKIAASLHRRYEAACSYSYANTDAYERRTERLEAKAADCFRAVPGVAVEHQRDPRGWPLILKLDGKELGRLG